LLQLCNISAVFIAESDSMLRRAALRARPLALSAHLVLQSWHDKAEWVRILTMAVAIAVMGSAFWAAQKRRVHL
jgi:hypothetical protein